MKKTNLILILVACLGLAACNTIDGLGQDVSSGAREVKSWF